MWSLVFRQNKCDLLCTVPYIKTLKVVIRNIIKMCGNEMGCRVLGWINLVQWRSLLNTLIIS
jgi:hypothetical protein